MTKIPNSPIQLPGLQFCLGQLKYRSGIKFSVYKYPMPVLVWNFEFRSLEFVCYL